MPYVITAICDGVCDTACVDVCPMDCIHSSHSPEALQSMTEEEKVGIQMFIHPEECIWCGACVPVCPVGAIFPEDEVPKEHQASIEANRLFFLED